MNTAVREGLLVTNPVRQLQRDERPRIKVREKRPLDSNEVARLLEGSEPPAILDAREATAYERSPVRIPRSLRVALTDLGDGGKRPDVDQGRLVVAYCS